MAQPHKTGFCHHSGAAFTIYTRPSTTDMEPSASPKCRKTTRSSKQHGENHKNILSNPSNIGHHEVLRYSPLSSGGNGLCDAVVPKGISQPTNLGTENMY